MAAASILARHEFVRRMRDMGKQYGMVFPKGASGAVDAAAKEFVAKFGAESLGKVAKLHFRTALRAQGFPEPPRVEWRSKRMVGGVGKPASTECPSSGISGFRTPELKPLICADSR